MGQVITGEMSFGTLFLPQVVHICETNARATLELDGAESRGTIRLVAADFLESPRLEYMTLSHM
jgi:hypothetical protein